MLDFGDSFFLQQKPEMGGRGPFSPSYSFRIDGKICQRNLTRIDRTIQKYCATRTGPVVSDDGSWVTMAVSVLYAQRAQFTFPTQGTVTHSQAQGSEAGAQPTFS